jgi:hypothetical protein
MIVTAETGNRTDWYCGAPDQRDPTSNSVGQLHNQDYKSLCGSRNQD